MKTGCFLSPVQPNRVIPHHRVNKSSGRIVPCRSAIFRAYCVSPVHSVRGNRFNDFHL